MKIIRIGSSGKNYGGNIYESYIDKIFLELNSDKCEYEVVKYQFRLRGPLRLLEVPLFLLFCWRYSRNDDFFVIRNFNTAFFPLKNRSQGCTIVYHIDETGSRFLVALYQKFLEWAFFFQLSAKDNLIVIADYWKKYFLEKGYNKIHLIYCPFEIEKYSISEAQVCEFKKRHGFSDKPILYLGNPQKKKGILKAFNAARDINAHLVSSGEGEMDSLDDRVRHMKLSFQEYLVLLKASTVVLTMSLFKEGWCRVAHEALLLGTPVIGSGAGGMTEILVRGGGIVCERLEDLEKVLGDFLKGRERNSANRLNELDFLKSFTVQRFNDEFMKMLIDLGVLSSDTSMD